MLLERLERVFQSIWSFARVVALASGTIYDENQQQLPHRHVFDYLIEFDDKVTSLKTHVQAAALLKWFTSHGMEWTQVQSSKKGRVAVALRGKSDTLFRQAEKLGLRLPLKASELTRQTCVFTRTRIAEFSASGIGESFFSSGERILLLRDLIFDSALVRLGLGKDIRVGDKTSEMEENNDIYYTEKIICELIPLHDTLEANTLYSEIVTGVKGLFLDRLKQYLGEERGFYFAFLVEYNRFLAPAAFLGVLVFYLQMTDGDNTRVSTIAYGLFISLWATTFLEHWKRKQARLNFHWDTRSETTCHDKDTLESFKSRSSLEYDEFVSAYHWVYPGYKVALSQTFSFIVCLLLLGCASSSITYFLNLGRFTKTEWKELDGVWTMAVHLPTAGYLGSVTFFSSVNKSAASLLTRLENPRTQQEYDNSLLVKLLCLQFVNNYGLLFYIAFVEQDLLSLHANVAALLGFYQVIGQVLEIGAPATSALFRKIQSIRRNQKMEEDHLDSDLPNFGQRDLNLEASESLFGEYLELWTQFGQLIMFSMIFPLAPLLALMNNVVEVRTDALKMLKFQKRCIPSSAEGIGMWVSAFELLGYLGVMTNVAILGVVLHTSDLGNNILEGRSNSQRILILVGLEHAIIAGKLVVSWFVPDVPSVIAFEISERENASRRETATAFKIRNKVHELISTGKSEECTLQSTESQAKFLIQRAGGDEGYEAMLVEWVKDQIDRRRIAQNRLSSLKHARNSDLILEKRNEVKFSTVIALLNIAVGLITVMNMLSANSILFN